MSQSPQRLELGEADCRVLRRMVSFGLLADRQICRDYGDAAFAQYRIEQLLDSRYVEEWRPRLEGLRLFSASRLGARHARSRIKLWKPRDTETAHHVAVVDLADYLVDHESDSEWHTEHELRRVLAEVGPPPARLPGDTHHPPDGLLVRAGRHIGVELEHSQKAHKRYFEICRWFVRELRLDEMRWYVDNPRLLEQLRELNHVYGFDQDIDARFEPFPPGVVMPRPLSRYVPRDEHKQPEDSES